jgi:hypothetical protein
MCYGVVIECRGCRSGKQKQVGGRTNSPKSGMYLLSMHSKSSQCLQVLLSTIVLLISLVILFCYDNDYLFSLMLFAVFPRVHACHT